MPDQQRALDKHPIGREKCQHFLLAHSRKFGFQLHRLVQKPARVKKFFKRQPAFVIPLRQLLLRRILRFDIADRIRRLMLVEPFLRLMTRGAFRLTDKRQHRDAS